MADPNHPSSDVDSTSSPPTELGTKVITTETPPTSFFGILQRLGPGLILAGSIVGSGELIATTITGAQAGYWLLWLVIIGCVIKVFAQVEIGRYTIVTGNTAMVGLNEVPGPRLRVNWIVWFWVALFFVSMGQLGGIVGGVGQGMALSIPLTEDGRLFNEYADAQVQLTGHTGLVKLIADPQERQKAEQNVTELKARLDESRSAFQRRHPGHQGNPKAHDDAIWASIITVITAVLLVIGRYTLIQNATTAMVASFTALTVFTVFALQANPQWATQASDIWQGLSFRLPNTPGALGTALMTFGIIGVGANELIAYPYWCLEKGYARFTGPRDDTEAWGQRPRLDAGYAWDAWCSMVVYTFATLAFYLLGAAVLHKVGMNPADDHDQMIRTLSYMYVHVFGDWTEFLFLFGAFAVLYSTFFVATAGQARVAADVLQIFGLSQGEANRLWWIKVFSGSLPFLSLSIYLFVKNPPLLVLASGAMQAIMLPMLGGAALYFRYFRCDPRLVPGRLWNILLWISVFGLLLAGGWLALSRIFPALKQI